MRAQHAFVDSVRTRWARLPAQGSAIGPRVGRFIAHGSIIADQTRARKGQARFPAPAGPAVPLGSPSGLTAKGACRESIHYSPQI
jgi:hypothetical protein